MITGLSRGNRAVTRAQTRNHQFGGKRYWWADVSGNGGAGPINYVIPIKANGSFSLAQPDGVSCNVLGTNAVDLSLHLAGFPANCASGAGSFAGGATVKASGVSSFCFGSSSQATGNYSVCFGLATTALGPSDVGFSSAAVNGSYSFGAGFHVTVTGASAFGSGNSCNAPLYGQRAHAAGQFAVVGDSQLSSLVARNSTSNETPTNLFLDGSSVRLVVPANTTWEFEIHIIARTASATGTYAKFVRSGIISRNSTVGSTAIATVDTLGTDRGSNANTPPAGWAVAVTADTTNGALDIQVTGAAATNIRWVAHVMLAEVAFP